MEITSEIIQQNIEKAKAKNQTAFTFLLNFYWNEVYGFILKRTENEIDTEDITIETFSKAFEKIGLYNPEYRFNTWLISIAKNVQVDLFRKQKNIPFVVLENKENQEFYDIADTSLIVEDLMIKEQNTDKLLKHIKNLKPHYQEIIRLRYSEELSYQKISEHLNEPLSNVKIRLLRIKKILAQSISNLSNEN